MQWQIKLSTFDHLWKCRNNFVLNLYRFSQASSNTGLNYLSTCANPSKLTKKRNTRKTKKYVELLVVTDNTSQQQKAPVKHLNSKELKVLIEHDFNLSVLFKLNPTRNVEEHSYNNLTFVDGISDFNFEKNILNINKNSKPLSLNNPPDYKKCGGLQSEIEERGLHETIIPNELEELNEFDNFRNFGTFQPELEEDVLESNEIEEVKEIPKNSNQHKKVNEEISSRTLAAYIEVCSNMKDPQRGLNAMLFHKSQSEHNLHNFPSIKNINVYNALLKGFASKGKFGKIQEIVKIAEDDNVALNTQSFANIFECLGRTNIKNTQLKQIRIFVHKMRKYNLTFDKIINEAIFTKEQLEYVLNVIEAYDPHYKLRFNQPNVQYANRLVNKLNAIEQTEMCNILKSQVKTNGILNDKNIGKLIHDQLEIEKTGYLVVKSITSKGGPAESALRFRKILNDHFKLWEESALDAFNRDIAALSARRSVLNLEPYLRCIPTKDFINIITDEAKKLAQGSETYSPTVNQLYKQMGDKVYLKYKVLCKQKTGVLDKILKIHTEYCKRYANERAELECLPKEEKKLNSRQIWQWTDYSLIKEDASSVFDHHEWVPTVLISIGKFLYHIVMHDLKIDVNSMKSTKHKNLLPAFYTIFRNQGRLLKEEVKPHPVLSRLYKASEPETLTFPASEVPMKCPPVPWTSVKVGGYMIAPSEVVRLPVQAATQKQRLSETDSQNLYPALDSLNQLAAVPWKVNEKILDVILEVFNSGGSVKLDVPQPPSALVLPNQDKKESKFQNLRQRLQIRRKQAEMYSLWCDCLYRLSLANHYRKDIFWLPHNMDFRGRVYPIPPHLNHLGSDLARSMLIFAEGRPLGPHGLDWLKIHLINLTGLKKRDCIEDRLIFADEIIDKILDSADNPLTGEMWWAQSEEPWQTLACCMEIAAAYRSTNPQEFISYFPVHQDGSCNGLQHYAALGRDSAGAYSVNLTASRKPQDVYSAVVALVEEQRAKDAQNNLPIAKVLEGFVHRKVIKQTVMTTVYGVTRFGARLQIAKQLKDLDNFPKEHVWSASHYLTTKTFDSLRCMFTSTREIQDWFTECARLISSVKGMNVEWITPLGLPVVQPYNRYRKLPKGPVYENFHMDKYERPNVMKQKNAFPPNFIHSLDSSHMMLTSLFCERAGITFVSVHDCYWTHPSTVSIMNKICREQFVALHSEPILENLSKFLINKYSCANIEDSETLSVQMRRKLNKVLRDVPKTSKFDIREVLDSIYFFS